MSDPMNDPSQWPPTLKALILPRRGERFVPKPEAVLKKLAKERDPYFGYLGLPTDSALLPETLRQCFGRPASIRHGFGRNEFLFLRTQLAHCPEEDYRAAMAATEQALASTPSYGLAAILFPDREDWLEVALRDPEMLSTALLSAANTQEQVDRIWQSHHFRLDMWWETDLHCTLRAAYTALYRLGMGGRFDASPVLVSNVDTWIRGVSSCDVEALPVVLGAFPSERNALFLARMLTGKRRRNQVVEALSGMRKLAIPAVQKVLQENPKERAFIESFLATLAPPQAAPPVAAAESIPLLDRPPWRNRKRGCASEVQLPRVPFEWRLPVDERVEYPDPNPLYHRYYLQPDKFAQLQSGAIRLQAAGSHTTPWWIHQALADFGEGFSSVMNRDGFVPFEHLRGLADVRLVPACLEQLARSGDRSSAMVWAISVPDVVAAGVVPIALGAGPHRYLARSLLRWLVGRERELVTASLALFSSEVQAAVQEWLVSDPLDDVPDKLPKIPAFVDAASLPALRTRDGKVLSAGAVNALVEMFAFSVLESPYAGVRRVKQALEPASLTPFLIALARAWVSSGGSTAHAFVLHAFAWFPEDDAIRWLSEQVSAWVAENQRARVTRAMMVLAVAGSDRALHALFRASRTAPKQWVKDAALVAIAQAAWMQRLSPDELEDVAAPTLGLEEKGTVWFDFGARKFSLGLDQYLKPFVCDESGEPLDSFPRARKTDDPALARQAALEWKRLSLDLERVASDQIRRLERAMITGRRWTLAEFRTRLAEHPLLRHLVRRLVFAYGEEARAGLFRIAEDGSFADERDATLTPDGQRWVSIVHPLDLSSEEHRGWTEIFVDYRILQPFPQLERPVYRFESPPPRDAFTLDDVATANTYALLRAGFRADGGPEGLWRFHGPSGLTITSSPPILAEERRLHRLTIVGGDLRVWSAREVSELWLLRETLSKTP